LASHNTLKIVVQETSLKAFSMLIHIMAQSGVKEGSNAKRDGFIASRGQYSKLIKGYVLLKWPSKLKDNGMINKLKPTIIG